MTLKVEFRVGEIDGKKKLRSIYTDLVNLPDPLYLGLSIRVFNYDDVTLYMRVDGYGTGWSFTTNNLGSLASGANIRSTLDNFGTRAKPGAALTETITVRLRAYTDAAYTSLKWTYERVIDLVFIKSNDGSWIQDVLNNFDDGTVQGWARVREGGTSEDFTVATDYVLSAPYSLKLRGYSGSIYQWNGYIHKTFLTPDRAIVYAILDLRAGRQDANMHLNHLSVRRNTTELIKFGLDYPTATPVSYFPYNKWARMVVPLPRNTSLSLRIYVYFRSSVTFRYGDLWMDDFRIISKD